MKPVLTKMDYYQRWTKGEFGNKLRNWLSYEDLMNDRYNGLVSVRHTITGSNNMKYGINKNQVAQVMKELGGYPSEYRFNEAAPDENLTIQGELCEDHRGWWLTYGTDKVRMREALLTAKTVSGLTAKTILKHFCCPSSYNDLQYLLDLYPEHVIEFSVYDRNLGDVPNRNTIIWEVRKY